MGSCWICAQAQYRKGSPTGSAVLQYQGVEGGDGLPQTVTPQLRSVQPWNPLQAATVSSRFLCSRRVGVSGGLGGGGFWGGGQGVYGLHEKGREGTLARLLITRAQKLSLCSLVQE